MLADFEIWPNIVHVAAILYLICFLFRDQILLRSFAIAGDVAYTAYYFGATDQPLWQAMFWSSLNIVINLVMIAIILRENRTGSFSADERELFDHMATMPPRHFRKFVSVASWHVAEKDEALIEVGKRPDYLYFVLSGTVTGRMGGVSFTSTHSIFLGDLAFLRDQPSVADSLVSLGSRYVRWPVAGLRHLMTRSDDLRDAVTSVLAMEVMEKFSRSAPAPQFEDSGLR